jgi:hypothetical protein
LGIGYWSGLLNNSLLLGGNSKDLESTQGNDDGNQIYFESVEIPVALCIQQDGNWTITLKIKNTGTLTSILIGIFVDDIEVDFYGKSSIIQNTWSTSIKKGDSIPKNKLITGKIFLDPDRPSSILTSKNRIVIKIRSAAGMEYTKLIELV